MRVLGMYEYIRIVLKKKFSSIDTYGSKRVLGKEIFSKKCHIHGTATVKKPYIDFRRCMKTT